MPDKHYELKPLVETQSIPVHWDFTQGDYDKLAKGHQSNWSVFLRDNVVHFCRVGGEEFYRFKISKSDDGVYAANNLEAYLPDSFYVLARQDGQTENEIKQHQTDLRNDIAEEVTGLLANYFRISVA